MMNRVIEKFNSNLNSEDKQIGELLAAEIGRNLPNAESKIWHSHPVWFLDGNPIVGYSKQKSGIRLMFWSGQGFEEEELHIHRKKFKDASVFFKSVAEIDRDKLKIWCEKSRDIQWDYKNIVKRKGELLRFK